MNDLHLVLATLIELKWTVQNAHWNSEGKNFYGLHKMFEDFFISLEQHIDVIAERIVTRGEKINSDLHHVLTLSVLKDFPYQQNIDGIIARYEAVIALIENNSNQDKVTEDILINLLGDLQKQAWILRAHLA